MKTENTIASAITPVQQWNQLDYETEKNPIEILFPVASETGLWKGSVPGGDEDFTGATVYPIKDASKDIRNLLLIKHQTKAPDLFEFAYLPSQPTQGCFVRFGTNSKVMLVTSDLLTAAALADRTPYSAHFSLYTENICEVANNLANAFPKAMVVICDDTPTDVESLPKNVCSLSRPANGFYDKVLNEPDQIKKKIDDCILAKNAEVTDQTTAKVAPKKCGMNGTTLIRQLTALILECVSISAGSALIIALYIFFTYLTDKVKHAPLLGLCSPARRCGKTQTLRLIAGLVREPFYVKIVTKSALEIATDEFKTPLLDELDTFIKDNPGLVGLINGGVEDGAGNAHTGKQGQVVFRKTYGAKLFAMIGRPPETIFDRSIIVSLKRKSTEETKAKVSTKGNACSYLSREVKKWCEMNNSAFVHMQVAPLNVDNDRFRDNYEPLLRIAACISDTIEREAREASVAAAQLQQATDDSGEKLISDIKRIFDGNKLQEIGSVDLAAKLRSLEGGVWSHSHGNKAIDPTRMSQMLELFEVSPIRIRIDGKQCRGYSRKSFEDAFSRYCTADREVKE